MGPVRKALKKSLILALILTFALPVGGLMLGVGLGIGQPGVWAVGIALMVAGFYGCPIGWVSYGNVRTLYRVVSAIVEEHLYSVREVASQLSLSEKEVRDRLDKCFQKRLLVGFKREGDTLVLNENAALEAREKVAQCPSCGAKFTYTGHNPRCPYCDTPVPAEKH